jgi:hypothetical protein
MTQTSPRAVPIGVFIENERSRYAVPSVFRANNEALQQVTNAGLLYRSKPLNSSLGDLHISS